MIGALALSLLASLPIAHRKVVAADGQALALYRYGVANQGSAPVLLLSDLGIGRQAFDYESHGLARFLAAHGLQVYVAELRGQGCAGLPASGYHLKDIESDVVAVVNAIGAPQIDLVVHGWVGTLALAASAGPLHGRVRRVVALSVPAVPDEASPLVSAMLEQGGHVSALGGDPEAAFIFQLVYSMGGRYRRGTMEGLRADAFTDLGPLASNELLQWMRSGELKLSDGATVSERLKDFDAPTMLFMGLADGFANPELAAPLREVSHARVTMKTFSRFELVAEDYSHLSMLQGEFAQREIYLPALEFLR